MRRALVVPIHLLLVAVALGAGAETAAAEPEPSRRLRVLEHPEAPFPYLEAPDAAMDVAMRGLGDQVAAWVARGDLVGAEMLLVERGRVAWHEVYGLRDLETGEAMPGGGIFRIRSMTKPMIGSAALRLIQDGRLGLEDPVAKFLPAFDHERGRGVTVRDLLAHTSGFGFSPFPRDRASYETLQASVDDLGREGPEHEPGEFRYSDAGTATLGAVIAAAAGLPLEEVLRREVLAPLGLERTFTSFDPAQPWAGRVHSTHFWNRDAGRFERYWSPAESQELPYFRASGGVYSSVFDYAVFLQAWMDALRGDDAWLSTDLARLALRPVTETPYGLHWELVPGPKGSPRLFGHGGSDGTMALALPEQEALLLFFTQSRGSDCRDQLAMLAGLSGAFPVLAEHTAWGRWRDRAPELQPVAVAPEILRSYVGRYGVRGEVTEVALIQGHLRLTRGAPGPDSDRAASSTPAAIPCRPALAPPFASVDLIPLGEHRFALGRFDGERIVETYWPGRELTFRLDGDRVVGYELAYDPQVVEEGRRYEWSLADPLRRREPVPEELVAQLAGVYESSFGAFELEAYPDRLEFHLPGRVDTLLYQGSGFFVGDDGDIVTFARDPDSGRWRLQALDIEGRTYTFERYDSE